MEKLKNFWNELDTMVLCNKRELLLGCVAIALGGLTAGMLLCPKKTVTIASNNGNNNTGSNLPEEQEEEQDEK